jgi:hypothetical protein
MTVIALQSAYLPPLSAAYNRRETEVTLLRPARWRAGLGTRDPGPFPSRARPRRPPWPVRGLGAVVGRRGRVALQLPVAAAVRSPEPYASWVVSLLAVVDASALHLAACPDSAPISARLNLQMGSSCFRRLARTLRMPVDNDPGPETPIQLTWEEFGEGWDRLTAVGFPLERSAEETWAHFQGWRADYELTAYGLAWAVDAAPGRWSGPRRHTPSSDATGDSRHSHQTPRSARG